MRVNLFSDRLLMKLSLFFGHLLVKNSVKSETKFVVCHLLVKFKYLSQLRVKLNLSLVTY